ncbi:hypothetical protein ABK040_002960 [Willaertia magna]
MSKWLSSKKQPENNTNSSYHEEDGDKYDITNNNYTSENVVSSSSNPRNPKKSKMKALLGSTVGITLIGGLATIFLFSTRYKVCTPNEYLVRTGLFINEMAISKKGILWPGQKATFVSMNPRTFNFNLHNMSKEKVEFNLPVTFTIGPIDFEKDMEGFKRYCKTVTQMQPKDIENLVSGMVEGETRGLTAQLTVEEMFNSKETFRTQVVGSIERDLNIIGMTVYNANIKEMSDYDENNKYFEYRKKRAIEKANYESQADVAEARREGEIAVELNRKETRIRVAQYEQEAKLSENKREEEIAKSTAALEIVRAENQKKIEIARIEAELAAKEREAELQKSVNIRIKDQQIEFMRSNVLASALVEAEAIERRADADYYTEKKKAEAIQLMYESQAKGLASIHKACGFDPVLTQFYLALNANLYPELAKQSAEAIKGLNPKIQIWNTGNDTTKNNDTMTPFIKMFQSISPLLEGVQNQGNLKMPDWLPKINQQENPLEANITPENDVNSNNKKD